MLFTGQAWTLWLPAVFFYGLAPLLDRLLGEDLSNPPESAVAALDADPYYRWITYLLVPVLWLSFIFSAWFVATQALPWHGVVAMVLICGTVGGFCINLGHELGHKNTALERWLAKMVLAPSGYGHFFIEHNRGHHRDVATPADPASSRMGESIYRFVLREMPGAFRRACHLETTRLRQRGLAVTEQRDFAARPDHPAAMGRVDALAGSGNSSFLAGGVLLGQFSADGGQLRRALWPVATGNQPRQV